MDVFKDESLTNSDLKLHCANHETIKTQNCFNPQGTIDQQTFSQPQINMDKFESSMEQHCTNNNQTMEKGWEKTIYHDGKQNKKNATFMALQS